MNTSWKTILHQNKYELLLIGLSQHLFIGLFLSDLVFYADVIWPITMMLLGISSIGLFRGRSVAEVRLQNILLVLVLLLPILAPIFQDKNFFMKVVSISYTAYFGLLLYEVMRYLLKPGRITISVLFASICGFLLLLEVFIFALQYMYYVDPDCMKNIDHSSFAAIFIDIEYFCVMVLTTIGFGDIVPATHKTKLFTSLFGVFGQIYNVVLVGILISRFSNVIARNESQNDRT